MSNTAEIDQNQLNSILEEVEAQLAVLAKSDLAKARPGESAESEDASDTSSTDPAGDNTSAASASPDPASASPDGAGSDDSASAGPPAGDDGSAPPPGADDGSASADPAAAAGGDPAADQGPIDPQALMAEYSKLSPEDQKLHYMCLKQVLMQTLAGAGPDASAGAPPPAGPDASASAPPPAASPAPAPAPDASAPAPALKAEAGMSNDPKANGDLSKVTGGGSLSKSELDAAIQLAVAPLIKAVKHVLEAPLRKSIISTADLPAAAPAADVSKMSREQVRAKLSEKLQAGTLSKSDKDLMIKFDTGMVKADQIAHLLK